jgi:hypothetical protein
LEDLKQIYYFEDLRGRYKDNINIDLKEIEWGTWIGFIWLWIGPGCHEHDKNVRRFPLKENSCSRRCCNGGNDLSGTVGMFRVLSMVPVNVLPYLA